MSTYHVDGRVGVITSPGIWRVLDDTGRVVGYGTEAEDAARIARALRVLDAMEQHLDNLREYVIWHGPAHDDGCSADDTCDCSCKPLNDAINAVCRLSQAHGEG